MLPLTVATLRSLLENVMGKTGSAVAVTSNGASPNVFTRGTLSNVTVTLPFNSKRFVVQQRGCSDYLMHAETTMLAVPAATIFIIPPEIVATEGLVLCNTSSCERYPTSGVTAGLNGGITDSLLGYRGNCLESADSY
ncbi:MAG: hypothetical protein WDO15_10120 [Bacteroidota bacterium]